MGIIYQKLETRKILFKTNIIHKLKLNGIPKLYSKSIKGSPFYESYWYLVCTIRWKENTSILKIIIHIRLELITLLMGLTKCQKYIKIAVYSSYPSIKI